MFPILSGSACRSCHRPPIRTLQPSSDARRCRSSGDNDSFPSRYPFRCATKDARKKVNIPLRALRFLRTGRFISCSLAEEHPCQGHKRIKVRTEAGLYRWQLIPVSPLGLKPVFISASVRPVGAEILGPTKLSWRRGLFPQRVRFNRGGGMPAINSSLCGPERASRIRASVRWGSASRVPNLSSPIFTRPDDGPGGAVKLNHSTFKIATPIIPSHLSK